MTLSERELEDLLTYHPYLIDEALRGLKPMRQVFREQTRLDLIFELPDQGRSIVELKVHPLTISDLEQLIHYCQLWEQDEQHPLACHHYLVGKRPANDFPLRQQIDQSPYQIRLVYFGVGEQIPAMIAYDESARSYVPYDSTHPYRRTLRLC